VDPTQFSRKTHTAYTVATGFAQFKPFTFLDKEVNVECALKVGWDGERLWSLFVLFSDWTSSAVCEYNMVDVVQQFIKAQTDCYRGHGELLEWIAASHRPCRIDVSFTRLDLYITTIYSYSCWGNVAMDAATSCMKRYKARQEAQLSLG